MNSDWALEELLQSVYEMALRKRQKNMKRPDGEKFAEMVRVRLGSRLPVYLPQRITDDTVRILSQFREKASRVGVQQFVVQTHFQSSMEVTPEARLTEDLGAESIDFLDIAFHLEKAFGIQIKPNELIMVSIDDDRYVQDGKLTDAGMEEVRRRIPAGNFDVLEQTRTVSDLRGAFTVETLVRFVSGRLDESFSA